MRALRRKSNIAYRYVMRYVVIHNDVRHEYAIRTRSNYKPRILLSRSLCIEVGDHLTIEYVFNQDKRKR